MRNAFRIAVLALLLVSGLPAAASPPPNAESADADCSFSHPQLPGRCNLTVPIARNSNPRQTCDAVLRCMNASACADSEKYCPNPGVAKTWKLEEARASAPKVNCAFSNATYSGWCTLSAPVLNGMTPQTACEAVRSCLNGSPCEGFTQYCDPNNRSGWRLEKVTPESKR